MGNMPVVRVLTARLGEIRTGPLAPQQVGLLSNVISGQGDPLRAQTPIDEADILGMAVGTTIGHIDVTALVLQFRSLAIIFRWFVRNGQSRQDHDYRDDRSKYQQATHQKDIQAHSHDATSRAGTAGCRTGTPKMVRKVLYIPMKELTMTSAPDMRRITL
jgi:hypothetical protein